MPPLPHQLDAMFGTAESPHPASDACEGFVVKVGGPRPQPEGPTRGRVCRPLRGALLLATLRAPPFFGFIVNLWFEDPARGPLCCCALLLAAACALLFWAS